MTVKEVIEIYKGEYDLIEIFVGEKFHTDFCDSYNPEKGSGNCEKGKEDSLNSYCMDYKAEQYELMDCDEYNNTILANTETTTKDYGWKNEKILCILISRKSIYFGEEYGLN